MLTLQPKTLADAERMESGLWQLAAEDPTLTIESIRTNRFARFPPTRVTRT